MITRDKLEKYAKNLMFEMNEDEYKTLEDEFNIILKQMEFIDNIDDINEVIPMTFPFDLDLDDRCLREDTYNNEISFDDMKVNINEYKNNMIKVPKVVE